MFPRTHLQVEKKVPVNVVLGLAVLCVVGIAVIIRVVPEWLHNPDLSHGILTPLVFVILIREARLREGSYLSSTPLLLLTVIALALAGLGFLGMAGLYAAALEWSHALVSFCLMAALSSLLLATLFVLSQASIRTLRFNWPGFVAATIWALSAPLPPGTYTRLTRELQNHVTNAVLFSLHWLGVSAEKFGNVINLAHASVGVEEACSGVRSLISCIFAAVFISAAVCRTVGSRVAIIALAAPLAIAMNFLRSLFLTLLAANGIDIQGTWHDITGYGILAVTAALLGFLAILLERLSRRRKKASPNREGSITDNALSQASGYIMLGTSTIAAAILVVFAVATKSSTKIFSRPPDITALFPESFPGWEVETRDDLHRFSSQLQTTYLFEKTYAKATRSGPVQMTLYVAYWPAGQAPVSLVASHTPDACWPGGGWTENPLAQRVVALHVSDFSILQAQHRHFELSGFPQEVWYWHLVGGRVIPQEQVDSPKALLSLAYHYGFSKEEPQWFIRFSSNRPWSEISDEPLTLELFRRLRSIGL